MKKYAYSYYICLLGFLGLLCYSQVALAQVSSLIETDIATSTTEIMSREALDTSRVSLMTMSPDLTVYNWSAQYGTLAWSSAQSYCESNGWLFPTQDEMDGQLINQFDHSIGSGSTIGNGYWTSNTSGSTAWVSGYWSGSIQGFYDNKSSTGYYVRCIIPDEEPPASTSTSATSTEAMLSSVAVGLDIIIVLLFIVVIGFMFNNLNDKKPWQH